MSVSLRAADARVLGRIFEREITGTLPAQFKSVRLPELMERGLVQFMTRTLPGWPPMIVEGWELTPLGHLVYCEWASRQESEP